MPKGEHHHFRKGDIRPLKLTTEQKVALARVTALANLRDQRRYEANVAQHAAKAAIVAAHDAGIGDTVISKAAGITRQNVWKIHTKPLPAPPKRPTRKRKVK